MNVLIEKIKEVLFAILPITLLVTVLHLTLSPLETTQLLRFYLGAGLIVAGLSIFLVGVDIGITPVGKHIGALIARVNKMWFLVIGGLLLGFLVSVAEPDLHILGKQIEIVTSGSLGKSQIVVVVSLGVAVMLLVGLLRIVQNISLQKILLITYGAIAILSLLSSPDFFAIAFDSSGATTGALTVPFMLALAAGISVLKKDSVASENDSFGLVGITSMGAILAVLLMSLFTKNDQLNAVLEYAAPEAGGVLAPFAKNLPVVFSESIIALLPLLGIFLLAQAISLKLPKRQLGRIFSGFIYTLIGLVFFLVGVNAGFMDVGHAVGKAVSSLGNRWIPIGIGFLLGLLTVLAEPAVHVLTQQIEEITAGSVNRKAVLASLGIGVAIAIALSVLRILVPRIQLWHYLLPGYVISFILTFFVPKLFVGIGFDSGGVASGPMTATFIFAFIQGCAEAVEGADILVDGFGMIAMVALMPILALQLLGFVFKVKSPKGGKK